MNNIPPGATPFDLEKALSGDTVITRCGQAVEDLHYFRTSQVEYPVYGVIQGAVNNWTKSGRWELEEPTTVYDLFMAPKPVESFANVYPDRMSNFIYKSLLYAKQQAKEGAISVCKITSVNGFGTKIETVHTY